MEKIQEFTVGQRIRARTAKGDYSDAIIVSITDSKYTVKWADNNIEEEITPDAINSGRTSAKWIPFNSTSTATTRRRFSTEASPPVFGTYRTSRQFSPADIILDENAHISSSSEQTPTSPRSGAENHSNASSNNSEPTSVSSISNASESSAKSPRNADGQIKKPAGKRQKPKVTTNEPDKNNVVTIEANKAPEVDTKDNNNTTTDLPAASTADVADSTPRDKTLKRSSSKRNSGKRKDGITRGESKTKVTDASITPPTAEVTTADNSSKTEPKIDSKPKKNDNISKGESKVKIKLPLETIENEVKSPKTGDKSSKSPRSSKKLALDESGSSKSSSKSPRDGDAKSEIKSPRGEKAPKSSRKSEDKPSAEIDTTQNSTDPKDAKQAKRKSEKRKSEKKTKVKGAEIQKTGEVLSPKGDSKQKNPEKTDGKTEVKTDTKTSVKSESKADVKTDTKSNTSTKVPAEKPVEKLVEKPGKKPEEKPVQVSTEKPQQVDKPEVQVSPTTEAKPAETSPVVPPAANKPKAAGAKKMLGPKMPALKPPSQSYIPRPTEEALISPRSAAAKKQSPSGIPESPLTSPRDPPINSAPKSPLTSPREPGLAKAGIVKLAGPSREGSPLRVPPTGAVKKVPLVHPKVAVPTPVEVNSTQNHTSETSTPKEASPAGSTSSSMEISNTNIIVTTADSGSNNNSAQEPPKQVEVSSVVSTTETEKVPILATTDLPVTTNTNEAVAVSSPKSPRSPHGDVFVLEWSFNQTERNVHMAVGKKGTSINWRNEEWGLAKGIAPLTHPKQFFEVVRVKGKSQQIQIGICKEDVRIEQSYKNSVISSGIIPGTWETIKIRRSKAGDVIGLLIDMEAKTLTLFVNGSPEQEATFANKHEWGQVDPITNPIFPFFCMHGDLELQISPLCQVGKYKAINWAHGDKAQLSSANRKSQATEFFDDLGLSKYRAYLEKEVDLKAITEADLKKLNIPLVPRKRILDALDKEKGGAETKN